jgi:outer membrane protein assembly factor BamB
MKLNPMPRRGHEHATRAVFLACPFLLFALLPVLVSPAESRGDWPMHRRDAARSGFTPEPISNSLKLSWTFRVPGPRPAWPTSQRVQYDRGLQPILVGETVLFGGSADDTVYALDAGTGEVRWTFVTDAPVRCAPAAWEEFVFVASDDGWLYALDLDDGRLLWKHRGGPRDERVLGNERIVSRWPARGGPVVQGGTVYYAAGIWPSDEVFIHALDARTGEVVWSNDRTGRMYMPQPHGGANANSGVAPQGYLLVSDDQLIVPTGRAVPAVFQRSDGELLYYHLQKNQHRGSAEAMLLGEYFWNDGCLFDAESGELAAQEGHGSVAATGDGIVRVSGKSLVYSRWTETEQTDRRGNREKIRTLQQQRLAQLERDAVAVIVADRDAVCGEAGRVSAIDFAGQRNVWWSHEVEGTVYGLASADGRLVATTDEGMIYFFDERGSQGRRLTGRDGGDAKPASGERPLPEDAPSSRFAQAAEEIIETTALTEGYCVDLGAGEGELALELARRTNLHIYAVEADPKKVAAARRRLHEAGLYGTRVTVHQADPAEPPYPNAFANLVVSSRSLTEPLHETWLATAERIQRPYGGQLCLGAPGEMQSRERGPVEGAGSWTHQNASSSNTLCSMDRVVKGPLRMHWFRDVDFLIPNRHGQGPAPLVHRGVMVVGGVHGLCGVDAYNGRVLWTYRIPDFLQDYNGIHHDVGVGETGGPFCLSDDAVFVRFDDRCLKLDLETGEQLAEFRTPVEETDTHRDWGYLAYRNGRVFGSVANAEHTISPRYRNISLRNESVLLFAMDAASGELLWRYDPKESIRHNAIAVTEERVYLIDRPLSLQDRIANPRRGGKPNPTLEPGEHPPGVLIALNAATGETVWRQEEDIFGTQLSVSEEHDVILMTYQAVRHRFFKLPSEIGGRIAAFSSDEGARLWDDQADYVTRPLINGEKVYAQGGAWNLKTGEPIPFSFDRSYGCGQISAGAHLMLFRSATLGYFDLTRDAGVENFGGIRTSCWINAVPAGGLVLVPDGSSQCRCSYQMRSWLALEPAE